ncbi:MAG TPA: hypothetical protein VKP52_05120 [Pseudolabrys sp.]|nr:hypothetical protein [Pseudolabrys sp.]
MNRSTIMGASIVLLLAAFVFNPAEAYHKRHHNRHHDQYSHSYPDHFVLQQSDRVVRHQRMRSTRHAADRSADGCIDTNEGRRVCGGAVPQVAMAAAPGVPVLDAAGNRAYAMADAGSIIGSRPSGCPHAYCGCGLRKYLGLEDKRLNLASNWARLFPRESGPRAALAAVRSGHVMYIEAAAGNGQWLIRDYNSGGGLSRMHVRDVRGYVFVNPHTMVASRSSGT